MTGLSAGGHHERLVSQAPRHCQVLVGDPKRARELLRAALVASPACLWFGEGAPEFARAVGRHDYAAALGSECDVLVYDAHAGLYPDVLAALLGTLRGGGVLCLLVPEWTSEMVFDDPALDGLAPWPLDAAAVGRRFLHRLRAHFTASRAVRVLEVARLAALDLPTPVPRTGVLSLNAGQAKVVEAVQRVATGHARRPLVLTADRGRGKSTALGAGLARLLRQRPCRVAVLAPGGAAVASLFEALRHALPEARHASARCVLGEGRVAYWRPADFLAESPPCDLLVIDEAAALGLPLLRRLATRHNRLIFSTTVHGYEGSGRGFAQRFIAWLTAHFRQIHRLELDAPVRWTAGDPLEALATRLFLLDAETATPPPGEVRCRWLDRDALARDEALLRQVFGLLVTAHYRTRPSDLRQLLDAPALSVLVAECAGQVVGVLLAAAEGGMDAALAEAVCSGRRRPRGHPLLQSLAAHGGWCEAPTLRLLRVMRIAVHAERRRAGIGSLLLAEARALAEAQGFDLLGTRFGLTPDLLRFWQHNGFRVARIGHRLDPASAAHSVQMLAPLSAAGAALCDAAASAFVEDLPWRLLSGLSALDPEVVPGLFREAGEPAPPDERTRAGVARFAHGRRDFEDALPALRRVLCHWLAREDPGEAGPLLVSCVLQGRRPRREQVAALRRAFAALARAGRDGD